MIVAEEKLKRLTKAYGKRRIWEIDFLRGVCILLMLFDHLMCDLIMVPDWTTNLREVQGTLLKDLSQFATNYWYNPLREGVRIVVVFVFMLLSGISCSFSRSNGIRFIKLAVVALVFTAFTYLAEYFFALGIEIPFGIPHILALSLLIYIMLKKLFDNKLFFLFIGVIIVIGGVLINFRNIGDVKTFDWNTFASVISGFKNFGVDSYGIIPYTGIFLMGTFIGESVYFDRFTLFPVLDLPIFRPLCFIGRNTLIIYILHQLLIASAVVLFAMSLGYKFT